MWLLLVKIYVVKFKLGFLVKVFKRGGKDLLRFIKVKGDFLLN